MVAGLKFLSKKSFNPQNSQNQKTVWERRNEHAIRDKRAQERERQLQKERDDEELARSRGDLPRVAFLYTVPPGMESSKNLATETAASHVNASNVIQHSPVTSTSSSLTSTTNHIIAKERQPGDDDAVAAFRRALWAADKCQKETPCEPENIRVGTVLRGTSYDPYQKALEKGNDRTNAQDGSPHLSNLERAVGRKASRAGAGSTELTLDEQIQRFPALAYAPRERGISSSHVGVTFQPLGSQIRNVRCMACGIWGHSRGERECRVSGWNPFESSLPKASAAMSTLASHTSAILTTSTSAITNTTTAQASSSYCNPSMFDKKALTRKQDGLRFNVSRSASDDDVSSSASDKKRSYEKKICRQEKREKKKKKKLKSHEAKIRSRRKDRPRHKDSKGHHRPTANDNSEASS